MDLDYDDPGYGASGWGIGASYDFEIVQVYANYFRAKAKRGGLVSLAERDLATDPDVTNVDLGSDKQTAWSIGLGIPVSEAGTVSLEYAQYKDYGGGSLLYRGTPMYASRAVPDGLESAPGHKAKGYSIGYKHEMSKRTHLYTYVSRIDNDRGIDVGWEKTNVAGEKQTNFSVGIVHAF
jgi:predicted porin